MAIKGLLRYGSVRNYGSVRLDFGKKYDTELRTELYSFRTTVTHALHFCFQVLHFSFLPMTLPRQLRSPLTLTSSHPSQYFTQQYCEQAKLLCHNYSSIVQS